MSPGDIAFAREDFDKAIELYREESKAPGIEGDRTHDGLVRALLQQDKIQEAEEIAKAWTAAAPHNAWAIGATGEVLYRRTDMKDAFASFTAALAADPCNAQARFNLATFYQLTGLHATAKQYIDIAHVLDPIDDNIREEWFLAQPRELRKIELTRYIADASYVTDKNREALNRYLTRLNNPTHGACRLANRDAATTSLRYAPIPTGPEGRIDWGLDVVFDGKPRRLKIDTGATGFILTRSAAAALHLQVDETTHSFGFGDDGAVETNIARVKSIRIGDLEFLDCDVSVIQKNPTQLQDGLIGGDVFRNFLLTLDFPGRVLKLDPLPPLPSAHGAASTDNPASLDTNAEDDQNPHDRYVSPTMKSWTSFYRSGHDILVPVRLNDHPSRLFIVDTGAGINLIATNAARDVGKVEGGYGRGIVGISGTTSTVSQTGLIALEFAGLRQSINSMTAIDMQKFNRSAGLQISGFLGAPILHQLTMHIDYRDQLLSFDYDPKRLQTCSTIVAIPDCTWDAVGNEMRRR